MMGEVIRVSGRAPDVGDLLREAMVSQKFADVALCCSGGQRFLAHRLVLSAASPYLQDVLLAHGKAAGYNEPITIILAEVEGAELAAILGLVYTGSATIPKSRLEAFTRAAETLHVRIPSFGGLSNFDNDHRHYKVLSTAPKLDENCELDSVKIEEESTRYVHCEKYPTQDRWFDSSNFHYNETCLKSQNFKPDNWIIRKKNCLSRTIRHTDEDHSSYSQLLEAKNIIHENDDKIDKIHFPENFEHSEKINFHDNNYEKIDRWPENNSTTVDLHVDSSTIRADRFFNGNNEFQSQCGKSFIPVESINSFNGPEKNSCLDSTRISSSEDKNCLDNNFNDYSVTKSPILSLPVHRTSQKSFGKQNYDPAPMITSRQATCGHLSVADGTKIISATSACATVTSDINSSVENSSVVREKNDMCAENCCGWKIPRRHVANRVPASPWCQLARPAHHSPKIRPINVRSRNDSLEPATHRGWNESLGSHEGRSTSPFGPSAINAENPEESSSSTSSLPLNLRSKLTSDSSGSTYNFKVPKTTEISSSIDETLKNVDGKSSKFSSYENSSPLFPTSAIFPLESAWKISSSQMVAQPDETSGSIIVDIRIQDESTDLHPVRVSNTHGNHEESRVKISQHAISPKLPNNNNNNDFSTCNFQTSSRIELSHPISRLCDTVSKNEEIIEREQFFIENNELRTRIKSKMMKDVEKNNEDTNINLKEIYTNSGTIVQSDNNNNEAEIDDYSIIEITRNVNVESRDKNETIMGEEEICINDEQHKCDECGKTFVTRASLKVHGRTHSGEKPFRCNDCGKEFSQLRNYKYHRSVHEGTREFAATCPECGKYFNDRGYLSSHMKIHRNRKEYACNECGKSFNQRVAYNMHVRIHTGVKPHQCEQCGKAFSRKMLLKQHLRTHSGERPYQCQICHKAFADRSNMTLHTRLHSGLKPYQCTLCSKAFTKKHHLKTHLNYHTGTKPYSCPNCSLRFSQSSNMRTHYKKCSTISDPVEKQGNTGERMNEREAAPSVTIVLKDKVAPSVGSGRTSSLTPPNSDQESNILTPTIINDQRRLRGYNNIRNKDVNDHTLNDT